MGLLKSTGQFFQNVHTQAQYLETHYVWVGSSVYFFLKNLLIVLPINTADSEHNYATSLAVQWLRPCFHYRGHRFLLVEALRSYKPFGQNRKKKRMLLPAEINYKIHLELKKKA